MDNRLVSGKGTLGEELTARNLRENDPRAFVNRIFRISIVKIYVQATYTQYQGIDMFKN